MQHCDDFNFSREARGSSSLSEVKIVNQYAIHVRGSSICEAYIFKPNEKHVPRRIKYLKSRLKYTIRQDGKILAQITPPDKIFGGIKYVVTPFACLKTGWVILKPICKTDRLYSWSRGFEIQSTGYKSSQPVTNRIHRFLKVLNRLATEITCYWYSLDLRTKPAFLNLFQINGMHRKYTNKIAAFTV